jgi:hypothetical protein
MQPTRAVLALVVSIALSLVGCTGNGDDRDGDASPTAATGQDGGPTPVQSGSATSGTYEYENAGLHVTIEIDGTAGTMEVDNATGRELPQPDFYILEASSGDEIEGAVTGSAPVPAGEVATFEISFAGIAVGEIGAIALLFGQDNYGLFVRTA